MTTAKKNSVRAQMELDIDSLLRSHGGHLSSSDDDGDYAAFPLRTVDEILNDSDSSDDSLSPTQIFTRNQNEAADEPIAQTLEKDKEEDSSLTWRRSRSRELLPSSSSAASLSSIGFRATSAAASSSLNSSARSLPPLFGSVKPNLKPGAALAAAAAASRSIPTPHAAAIKNRRAGSSGSIQKVESLGDLQERGDLSDLIASFVVNDGEQLGISAAISNASSSLSSVEAEETAVSAVVKDGVIEGVKEVCSVEEVEKSFLEEAKEDNLDEELVDSISLAATSAVIDENAEQLDDALLLQDAVVPIADPMDESGNQEDGLEVPNDERVYDSDKKAIGGEEIGGGIGEDGDIGYEIDKMTEDRLEPLDNNRTAETKAKKPLELAEELEKRHASYGLHWEEGAVAQPMRLKGIRKGPPAIGYLQMDLDNTVTRAISSQTFKRDYGSPQVVAVHMNFIAIGTLKGAVLIFPSKYSTHSPDHMDSKMLTFGSHGVKSQAAVTSMCFSQLGDLLLVGYFDGNLTVWDVQRATLAKVIADQHTSPVVHASFLGQFKAVTGDSKGLILLHTFSVVPVFNRYTVKSQCFLDGQSNGCVLSLSPLLIDGSHGIGDTSAQGSSTVSTSGLGSMVGGVVGGVVGGDAGWKLFNEGSSSVEGVAILVHHQNALVVRLPPEFRFYDTFPKPDGARDGSMPYTAWNYMRHPQDSSLNPSDNVPWLVIAWDRRVQVAQLVKSKMKFFREWSLDSTAIGVAWLDDQMLVVLTLRGQLCLFSKDGSEIHRTSFVTDSSTLDDIILYHTHFTNSLGNPEKAYHNSIAVRGATVYVLGPMHLLISRLLPWKERIQVLQRAGDWMGALDMAMRLYDGHAQGVIDLPRNIGAIRDAIMPYLGELILLYVDEVFSYISVSFGNQLGKPGDLEGPKFTESCVRSEIEEQYARVGGVAVEFCVHIKRTDILFDRIFSKFVSVEHGGTFLEILEPYILMDMLGCLPPEIMQALVEHYSAKGWLQRVEQCILHMDISSLDFNQVVRLCREHSLFGALIYLFNRGLDDFRSPLEELLVVIQDNPSTDVAAIGYRMLVYLKYCFQGLAFPPGHGSLSSSRLPSVRKELLQFLLEDSKSTSSNLFKRFESLNGNFPNICYLLLLDTEATLDVLRRAFTEEECKVYDVSLENLDVSGQELGTKYHFENLETQKSMAQSTVDVLGSILDLESDVIRSFTMDENTEDWPSAKDVGHLLKFIALLVVCNRATISGRVLKHILEYLTSHSANNTTDTRREEKQVVSLLKTVPQTEWDSSYVLHLCAEAHFYQACGLIHTVSGQYISALDSYMKDLNDPIHAFSFINTMLLQLRDVQASSFRSAVLSRIPELIKLSRECTYFLVIDHFNSESQNILANLHSHPQSLFLFLKTVIDVYLSGSLKFPVFDTPYVLNAPAGRNQDVPNELATYLERLSKFQKLLHHKMISVTEEITELYLELLCKFERNSVLKFLETFDNYNYRYRLEHCLRLCQEYGVIDAAAFLLERAGDVGSALGLVMTSLHDKIDVLVTAVEKKASQTTSGNVAETDQFTSVLKMEEVICVHDVLNASIGLCQRNTTRLDQQESESLWFRLLDSFSEPLRMFFRGMEFHVDMLSTASETEPDESKSLSVCRVPNNRNCANILRRVFTKFVGEIIEGMIGYIPLTAIMGKLLSDNANQEFGDFKLTILKMLGTYGYEKRILDTAKSLIEDDTFYSMGLLKKGSTHAFVPHDTTCCICGCFLSKSSTTFGIRVFSCGHSTHLQCETEENDPSHSYASAGCPICLPKKRSQTKNKSVRVESGLVTSSTTSFQPIKGISNVQHAHEPDIEKSYAIQQMSRFEILNNLRKSHKSLQVDALPQLRLSPPAIYHDKIQMGSSSLPREATNTAVKKDKSNKRWQPKDLKSKRSLNRFPLKSSIFGPERAR